LDDSSSSDTIEKWDSLRQILIAKMLEQTFSITLSNDDLAELTSVRSIQRLLEAHGVADVDDPLAAAAPLPPDGLLTLLAQALEVKPDELTEDSSSENVGKWDSLRQILIAKMIEQQFSVTLSNDDLAELTSVRAVRALLASKDISLRGAADPAAAAPARAAPAVPSERPGPEGLLRSLSRPVSVSRIFEIAERLKEPAIGAAFAGSTVRVAIAGSLTTDFLAAAVACGVFQEGMLPVVYNAPFAAYLQEVLNPASALYAFRPDVVVLAPDWRESLADLPIGASRAEVEEALGERVDRFKTLWSRLKERAGCKIVQHLLVPPSGNYCGVAERRMPAAPRNQIATLNAMLVEAAGDSVSWIELDRLAEQFGLDQWNASRFYFTSKLPFDPLFLPAYLDAFRAAWRVSRARAKKVLALDLDNTVWGGVIGDDGVEGIKLGPATPAGEAFTAWGAYLKGLSRRGVILAACSKNSPQIALEAFNHPHSPLKADDFAAFEVSWEDKVGGLRRIAKTLNLGIDTIVFADDNPFECDLVRQNLPDVAVVELGNDPTAFVGLLDAGHWFDLPAYTKEDLQRSKSYQARREAEKDRESATDIDSYLSGLDMVGRLYVPDVSDLTRLAQMEQKTNQFNMTTRRYGVDQLRDFLGSPDHVVLAFQLRDRHADHGLVASLIAHVEEDALHIDSWLMSCRVFSRSAEEFIMNGVIADARERGVKRVVGEYFPTAKNGVVAQLYKRLGFSPIDNQGKRWELPLDRAVPATTFIAAGSSSQAAGQQTDGPARPPARGTETAQQAEQVAAVPSLHREADFLAKEADAPPSREGGEALPQHHEPDDADTMIAAVLKRHPGHLDLALLHARTATGRKAWPEAASRWLSLARAFPDVMEGYVAGAEALQAANRLAEAADLVQSGLNRFPAEWTLHLRAAQIAYARSAWTAEASHWSAALAHQPDATPIAIQLAEALCRAERPAEAETLMAEFMQRFPNDFWPATIHAEIAIRQGRRAEGLQRFRDLTARFPTEPEVYTRGVLGLRAVGGLDEAAALLDIATQHRVESPVLDLTRALVADAKQNWSAALDYSKRLVDGGQANATIFDIARRARRALRIQPKKTLVIYGSCQGATLSSFADQIMPTNGDFEVYYLASHLTPVDKLFPERLENAVLCWEQHDSRAVVPLRDKLHAALPPSCVLIKFPAVTMMSLWPFDWPEPSRNRADPPRFPFGRFPYGDSIGLEVAAEGLKGEAAFERYMELSHRKMPNIEALLQRDMAQLRQRDNASDVKIGDFILQNLRTTKMFATWGHLYGEALIPMFRDLIVKSEIPGFSQELMPSLLGALMTSEDEAEVPIHPAVAKQLDLQFYKPDSLYNWQGNRWTFKEYTIRYIENSNDW
jgi:FkbH-like protein